MNDSLQKIADKIANELLETFREFQQTTAKTLELTNFIELESISGLYNIAIRINYANSRRKFRNYLNFTRSATFNENKEILNQLLSNDEKKFMNYIENIIQDIKTQSLTPKSNNSITKFLQN